MARVARMKKEIQRLTTSPPCNSTCWPVGDNFDELQAQIFGGEGSPYENGSFKLEVNIPERYPFEPPKVRFLTKIYHPNIDPAGRICLDVLKMPPQGSWKPSHNICTIITSIQLLMMEPNPDDPLMTDIADIFRYKKAEFEKTAREWTMKYARDENEADGHPAKENVLKSDAEKTMASSKQNSLKTKSSCEDSVVKSHRLSEDSKKRLSEGEDSKSKHQRLTKDGPERRGQIEDLNDESPKATEASSEDDLFPDT